MLTVMLMWLDGVSVEISDVAEAAAGEARTD